MPPSNVDVLLVTDDLAFAELVGKHCPASGALARVGAADLDDEVRVQARQVWIDLDSVPAPKIGAGPRRVYFTSEVKRQPDALPNGLYIRKPCAGVVFEVLWADSTKTAHTVVVEDKAKPPSRLPGWLLDFHEIRVSAFSRKVVTGLPPRLGYRHASLYIHDFDRGVFTLSDTTHTRVLDTMIPVNDTQQHLMSAVAHARRPFSTTHTRDELAARGIQQPRGHVYEDDACLVIPLVCEGQVWGVLNLSGAASTALTEQDIPYDDLYAFLGRTLYHARMFERAQTEARVDCLTGLFNQRWMNESLDREVRRAERHNNTLAVLVVDLDALKSSNDSHGHACGDEVLRFAANRITRCLRHFDSAARTGGDEFTVLLPATDRNGARRVAKRIVDSIAAKRVRFRQESVRMTASVGVAEWHDGWSASDLLEAADAAMYRAKKAGGNSLAVSGEETSTEQPPQVFPAKPPHARR